jgi:hypothetical protein
MLYPKTPWRDRVFTEIDYYLHQLNWDMATAKKYLSENYGCTSRHQLTDQELTQFSRHLDWTASNPTKKP